MRMVLLSLAMGLAVVACRHAKPTPASQPADCAGCHAPQKRLLASAAHARVACADCHGCSHALGVQSRSLGCLDCHDKVVSFEKHVRAIEQRHVVKLDTTAARGRCEYCHEPHGLQ